MATPQMTHTFRFRGTKADARNLKKLARHYDRTPSDVLRRLVTEAAARIGGTATSQGETHGGEEK